LDIYPDALVLHQPSISLPNIWRLGGYKLLLEVERAFRSLKSTLNLRPVYQSKDDRIRSHVILRWLSLLLVRIAEAETGLSWSEIRGQVQQQHLIDLFGKNGRILQH